MSEWGIYEDLKQARDEAESLRAQLSAAQKEIEGLNNAAEPVVQKFLDCSEVIESLRSENSALKARCERMREALEEIRLSNVPEISIRDRGAYTYQIRADEALRADEGSGE